MPQVRLARQVQVLLATPMGNQPRGRPRTRWSDYISDLAWSHLGAEPADLFEIAVDSEVFQAHLGLLPCDPSQRKSRHKNK